jgi:hypothetical protein
MPRRREGNTFVGRRVPGRQGSHRMEDALGKFARGEGRPTRPTVAPDAPEGVASKPTHRATSEPRHEHTKSGPQPRDAKPASSAPRTIAQRHPRAPAAASHPVHKARAGSVGGRPRSRIDRDAVGAAAGQAAGQLATRRALAGQEPTVSGHAVTGALAGASAGATLGSAVPGVGNAIGAGVGGAVGTAAGALGGAKAKKAFKKATRKDPGARKALIVEFLVCLLIVVLSPLNPKHKGEGFTPWVKRTTAVMFLFVLLGVLSAAGRGAAKLAVALGGLMTVVLALSQRDLIVTVTSLFGPSDENQLQPDAGSTYNAAMFPPDETATNTAPTPVANAGAAGGHVIAGLVK